MLSVDFVVAKELGTLPLRTDLQDGWRNDGDKESKNASVLQDDGQVRQEDGYQYGAQRAKHNHSSVDQEKSPSECLTAVLTEDGSENVVDHCDDNQRENRADVDAGEKDDIVGEDPKGCFIARS